MSIVINMSKHIDYTSYSVDSFSFNPAPEIEFYDKHGKRVNLESDILDIYGNQIPIIQLDTVPVDISDHADIDKQAARELSLCTQTTARPEKLCQFIKLNTSTDKASHLIYRDSFFSFLKSFHYHNGSLQDLHTLLSVSDKQVIDVLHKHIVEYYLQIFLFKTDVPDANLKLWCHKSDHILHKRPDVNPPSINPNVVEYTVQLQKDLVLQVCNLVFISLMYTMSFLTTKLTGTGDEISELKSLQNLKKFHIQALDQQLLITANINLKDSRYDLASVKYSSQDFDKHKKAADDIFGIQHLDTQLIQPELLYYTYDHILITRLNAIECYQKLLLVLGIKNALLETITSDKLYDYLGILLSCALIPVSSGIEDRSSVSFIVRFKIYEVIIPIIEEIYKQKFIMHVGYWSKYSVQHVYKQMQDIIRLHTSIDRVIKSIQLSAN